MIVESTSERIEGPGIELHCPTCNRETPALCYELDESVKVLGTGPWLHSRNTWLQCTRCGERRLSQVPPRRLKTLNTWQMSQLVGGSVPPRAQQLTIAALVLCLVPIVGVIAGFIAVLDTLKVTQWQRMASRAALGLALAISLAVVALGIGRLLPSAAAGNSNDTLAASTAAEGAGKKQGPDRLQRALARITPGLSSALADHPKGTLVARAENAAKGPSFAPSTPVPAPPPPVEPPASMKPVVPAAPVPKSSAPVTPAPAPAPVEADTDGGAAAEPAAESMPAPKAAVETQPTPKAPTPTPAPAPITPTPTPAPSPPAEPDDPNGVAAEPQPLAGEEGSSAKPGVRSAPNPANWRVIFSGRDPEAWNSDGSVDTLAKPLSTVPRDVRWLKLKRLDTGESLIVAVTHAQLNYKVPYHENRLPARWNGGNESAQGARHLGIAEGTPANAAARPGQIAIQLEGIEIMTGSGFGHLPNDPTLSQQYSWRGAKIRPTAFEISVTSGDLIPAEQAMVVGKTR